MKKLRLLRPWQLNTIRLRLAQDHDAMRQPAHAPRRCGNNADIDPVHNPAPFALHAGRCFTEAAPCRYATFAAAARTPRG